MLENYSSNPLLCVIAIALTFNLNSTFIMVETQLSVCAANTYEVPKLSPSEGAGERLQEALSNSVFRTPLGSILYRKNLKQVSPGYERNIFLIKQVIVKKRVAVT